MIRKKKHKKRNREADEVSTSEKQEEEYQMVKLKGSGRIITSGTTVMGRNDTKFLAEVAAGDAIIIQHPTTFQEETRIVTMVLSDISMSISSPFSSDLISSTLFHYIKAPPQEEESPEVTEAKKRSKKMQQEKEAFGTYAGGTAAGSEYTYRVRKQSAYGGYTIVKEKADENTSREELLNKRTKRKADRYCN